MGDPMRLSRLQAHEAGPANNTETNQLGRDEKVFLQKNPKMTPKTFLFPNLHYLKMDFAASGWRRHTWSCPYAYQAASVSQLLEAERPSNIVMRGMEPFPI